MWRRLEDRIARAPDGGEGSPTPGAGDGAGAGGDASTAGGSLLTGQGAPGAQGGAPGGQPGGTPPAYPEWQAGLDPQLRTAIASKNWDSPAKAISSYLELEKKVGANTVKLPGKDATPEERAAFNKALGVPDKPEDYKLDFGNNPVDPKIADWLKQTGHKRGYTAEQLQGLAEDYFAFQGGQSQDAAAQVAKEMADVEAVLKREWPGEIYSQQLDMANSAISAVDPDGKLVPLLAATGLGRHPALIKLAAMAGASMAEDGQLVGGSGGMRNAGTPAAAKAELDSLAGDESFKKALLDPRHPQHKQAVERRGRLLSLANRKG